ncbi:PQQ-dependent sugar dehydrogenase [Halorarius halobius]|uniref:PQQ-dependent sugar dehydrogenase n=1 Tax=Halorarius halobius TaxID=2962671 RepID=UPI0020CE1E1D|nr:PQQ-dependent sugar dehydrogenase [Halorarius halobius]
MDRRTFLACAAGGTAALSGCTLPASQPTTTGDGTPGDTPDDTPTDGDGPRGVGLETLATGLRAPLDVVFAGGRRYVAEQPGVVRVHESGGLRETPLLDLRDAVTAGGEKGLLGVALHPDFPDDRRLFVRYSAPPRAGTPDGYSHTFVLASFAVTADGRTADPDSERTILEIPEPQGNHNAGSLAFGPDGYLYVGVGDGGAGGDRGTGHVDDWYDAVPGGNGQDVTENLLGSVLRIDVDGGDPYAVPDSNPLVGREGLDEQYAWGFRNPWRFSFDREALYVADVGQSAYEEVSRVERGGNYGWNVKEGTHCYGADDCPDTAPVRGGEPLRDPVVEYPHSGGGVSGVSVIGGYVYRGSALSGLGGDYVFGDLNAGGRLFAATPADEGLWPTHVVPITEGGGKLDRLLSFGRGPDGDLYVLGLGSEGDGGLHRIVPA